MYQKKIVAYNLFVTSRGVQSLGLRSTWWPSFVQWLKFCGSSVWNLLHVTVLAASKFLEHSYTPVYLFRSLIYVIFKMWNRILWSIDHLGRSWQDTIRCLREVTDMSLHLENVIFYFLEAKIHDCSVSKDTFFMQQTN